MKVLITLFLSFVFYATASASTIVIKSKAKVVGEKHISLYSLVKTKTLSAVMKSKLKKVILSDAPQKGERRIFTSRAISQALRSKIKDKSIKFVIPKHVIVENPVYTITQEAVKTKILETWKSMCAECEFTFTDFKLPKVSQHLKSNSWQIQSSGNVPMGSFSELLKIKNNSETINYWVTGHVKISKKVPVLKRTLFIGQSIQPEDIQYEVRDITFLKNRTVPKKDQIFGKRLRTGLRSNEIVWMDSLAREKALNRGDIVQVSQDEEEWSVSLNAIAQQDGFVGDIVKLLNPNTNKMISGKVIGKNKVSLL